MCVSFCLLAKYQSFYWFWMKLSVIKCTSNSLSICSHRQWLLWEKRFMIWNKGVYICITLFFPHSLFHSHLKLISFKIQQQTRTSTIKSKAFQWSLDWGLYLSNFLEWNFKYHFSTIKPIISDMISSEIFVSVHPYLRCNGKGCKWKITFSFSP